MFKRLVSRVKKPALPVLQQQYIHLDDDLPDILLKPHARATRIKIKISAQDIKVIAPPTARYEHVVQFLQQSKAWIKQHWQPMPTAQQYPTQLQLFQHHANISVHYVQQEQLKGKFFIWHAQQSQLLLDSSQKDLAMKQFILSYAKQHLPAYLQHIAQTLRIQVSKISIRHAKTRWGSCSRQNAIMLNAALVRCPEALVRYVCIHELAHTVHFDHSPAFWAWVARHDVNYQQHRQALKQYALHD
ncbi:MAG: SprT family zinc-dependent metalloprotease [Acinetobacter sp.]|nr:SprT family zinc-dependent metalloprotease [Acinetobacter sp.]